MLLRSSSAATRAVLLPQLQKASRVARGARGGHASTICSRTFVVGSTFLSGLSTASLPAVLPQCGRSFSGTRRRTLPPSVHLATAAAARMAALLKAQPEKAGLRLDIANDWGSPSGFTYTLGFVAEGGVEPGDERIELPDGAGALFLARKALWVGEGGLVGATVDLDSDYNLIVTPPDSDTRQK